MDRTILVIEDDPSIRELTQLGLSAAGFEVVTASDGWSGLGRFRDERPDLVVLDLMLPGMDGLEVCRQIRMVSVVPIVMLTALADSSNVVAGLEAGADDYVTKPFELPVLVARVRAALRRVQLTMEELTLGPVRVDLAGHTVHRNGDEVVADRDRVPAALRPGLGAGKGPHQTNAARPGLGVRLPGRLADGRRGGAAPPGEDRE